MTRYHNTTVDNLVQTNNIKNPNIIYPGQRLTIKKLATTRRPTAQYYTVKKGDTLSHIALAHGTTVASLVQLNNIKDPNKIFIGQRIRIK